MTRRLIFFTGSIPLAVMLAVIVTEQGHTLRFWLCEVPLGVLAFAAWLWTFVEFCKR